MSTLLHHCRGTASPKKQRGHTEPRAPLISLDQPGRLRVANVLAILGVSHTTLYAGMKTGRYPLPDGRDRNLPYWNTATIKAFLGGGVCQHTAS